MKTKTNNNGKTTNGRASVNGEKSERSSLFSSTSKKFLIIRRKVHFQFDI